MLLLSHTRRSAPFAAGAAPPRARLAWGRGELAGTDAVGPALLGAGRSRGGSAAAGSAGSAGARAAGSAAVAGAAGAGAGVTLDSAAAPAPGPAVLFCSPSVVIGRACRTTSLR